VANWQPNFCWAYFAISSTAIGISGTLYDGRVWPRYTGKERDAESGLDYFGARYYASNMRRWMSPDWADKPEAVPYSSLDNPQSLNLYGYVLNNPLSHADSDGHCCDLSDVVNFIAGAANAYGSDNLLGAGRVNQSTGAGQLGARLGDSAALATGTVEVVLGAGGEVGGVALDATGVGAVVGVPVNVVSAGVIAHGATTDTAAAANLMKSGGNFSSGTKQGAKDAAGGKCQSCGTETTPGQKSQKGVTPPGNEGQTDHIQPSQKAGLTTRPMLSTYVATAISRSRTKFPNQ
jgi:RHS repeat-associated protein